jgi:hypothetical protein
MMNDYVRSIALMAAVLEAGDRAAQGGELSDPIQEPAQYVARAVTLIKEATWASEAADGLACLRDRVSP